MFEIHNNKTAVYSGETKAASIASAVLAVQQEAREQEINEFVANIPNREFGIIGEMTRLVGIKPLIESHGDNGVTVRYTFHRQVTVMISGSPMLTQTPSEPIDLAHRRVVGGQTNGIESL
jgi:hypothetical protein